MVSISASVYSLPPSVYDLTLNDVMLNDESELYSDILEVNSVANSVAAVCQHLIFLKANCLMTFLSTVPFYPHLLYSKHFTVFSS